MMSSNLSCVRSTGGGLKDTGTVVSHQVPVLSRQSRRFDVFLRPSVPYSRYLGPFQPRPQQGEEMFTGDWPVSCQPASVEVWVMARQAPQAAPVAASR